MQPVADRQELAREPRGRYLLGSCWLHWCADAGLYGVVLWGRPDRESIAELVDSLTIEIEPGREPHRSVVDASRVSGVDGEAFELLVSYVRDHQSELAEAVTELHLVRPSGLPGAITAGFFEVSGAPYPVVLYDHASVAYAGVERPELDVELSAIIAEAEGGAAQLSSLRAHLAEGIGPDVDLASAAAALGVSERSLQRHLGRAGTTFQAELTRARISAAKDRMQSTDDALTTIALDVGFSSPQHFARAFRRAEGMTPSAWRSRRRRGG